MQSLNKPSATRRTKALPAAAMLLLAAAPGSAPTGFWLTENAEGVILFEECGNALCGRITGFTNYPRNGVPPKDWLGRSQCGLELTELERAGPNLWRGDIVDPRNGHHYDAEAWMDEAGRLRLRGFELVPLLGETQTWTRYRGAVTPDCHVRPAR